MIALLTGKIAYKSPEFIIMDVNGVGYRVQIPFSTYYELPAEGKEISLQIYTHVKEDAIHLYGFRSLVEKNCFQLLLSVSGIGPKLGKDILSNIQAGDLVRAVSQGNLARLSAIPGIGKKTAERMVLELRSKIVKLEQFEAATEGTRSSTTSAITDDVASALVNLGYKEGLVRKVLSEMDLPAGAAMEEILKQALKHLMK
jgi:Holliday junction DNA helicase RuvA